MRQAASSSSPPPTEFPPALRRLRFWLLFAAGTLLFLYLIRAMLLPFVVGILTAYFLDPAADRLEKWGMGRGSATACITIGFFSAILLAVIALLPVVAEQMGGLLAALPEYLQQGQALLRERLAHLPLPLPWKEPQNIAQLGEKALPALQELFGGLVHSGMVAVNLLSLLVITPVVAFYLLRDWDRLVAALDNLWPRRHADTIREQLRKIDETLAGFIRGQFNVMLILGVFYAITLSVAGLKFGVLVGLLSGFLIIIPYLGTFLAGITAVGIALLQFDELWQTGVVAAIFVLGQMMEGYVLTPRLVGSRVGLHPVWVIFGMLAGGTLFGFVGILLAVPVTAVIGVLVRFGVARYLESPLYKQ